MPENNPQPQQEMPHLPDVNLEEVIGYTVYDKTNDRIGGVTALWTDHTGQPAFIGVRTTWLVGKTHVVPAYGAEVNHDSERIRIQFRTEDVKDAPCFDPDEQLDMQRERQVMDYYRAKDQSLPELPEDTGAQAAIPNFGPGHTAVPGAVETQEPQPRPRAAHEPEDTVVRLHEEQLSVGKREVSAGGVRLRKIVRTETVQRPIELQREEIVIERTTASDKPAAPGETELREGEEIYIPLRREIPVVHKESVVREEVRARKKSRTEQQTVSEEVRHEEAQVEEESRTDEEERAA